MLRNVLAFVGIVSCFARCLGCGEGREIPDTSRLESFYNVDDIAEITGTIRGDGVEVLVAYDDVGRPLFVGVNVQGDDGYWVPTALAHAAVVR
jgi:hypothetical protein